jgi:hypothetical protein
MPTSAIQVKAGGTIYPCRFITNNTTSDSTVDQAGANELIYGVSGDGTNYPPLDEVLTGPQAHATVGQMVEVQSETDVVLIEAGGVITMAAPQLKSDADGKAVAIATTGTTNQFVGAIALEAAATAGEKIRCIITRYVVRPAVA